MSTIIDGYNLLFVAGIVSRGVGPGTLARAREALLNFIATVTPADQLRRTTVVFDANDPPPGAPRILNHRGITVRFAVRYASADELIEELIRADSAPRKLLVVSSDHRVQRAAHRRRAKTMDSDVWYDEMQESRRSRPSSRPASVPDEATQRRSRPLTDDEIASWLREFGEHADDVSQRPNDDEIRDVAEAADSDPADSPPAANKDDISKQLDDPTNPFPPGYAEDLDE